MVSIGYNLPNCQDNDFCSIERPQKVSQSEALSGIC